MSQRLVLKDTKLVRLTAYPGEDGTTQVLAVRALLTRTLAEQLKCHDLCFAENNMPRRFGQLKLTENIEDCEILFGANPNTMLANQVSHFSIGRPKEASATDASLEVSLSLHFAGAVPLKEWFDQMNKAQFEITVKPPATWDAQQNLFEKADPDQGDGGEEPNCVDCENDVPFAAGDPLLHASGQRCTNPKRLEAEENHVESEQTAPLASAREAAGGTHQRKGGATGKRPKGGEAKSESEAAGPVDIVVN